MSNSQIQDIVNKGIAGLRELSQQAAEMTRLLSLATQNETNSLTGHLADAMALDQAFLNNDAEAVRRWVKDHNGNVQAAIDIVNSFGITGADTFIRIATGYADTKDKINNNPLNVTMNTGQVGDALQQVWAAYDGLRKTLPNNPLIVGIGTAAIVAAGGPLPPQPISGADALRKLLTGQAEGSIMHFANGGLRMMSGPLHAFVAHTPTVTFGERETGGEAYIPLGTNKRVRSAALLHDVARMFGYALVQRSNLMHMQDGGTVPSGYLPGPVEHGRGPAEISLHAPVTFTGNIDSTTLPEVDRLIAERNRELLMALRQRVGWRT